MNDSTQMNRPPISVTAHRGMLSKKPQSSMALMMVFGNTVSCGAPKPAAPMINVKDGNGVRGTVPQLIRSDTDKPVDLMFRPSAVFRNSAAVVECGEKELIRKKAMIFTPGEMALVTIKPEMLKELPADSITVRIE